MALTSKKRETSLPIQPVMSNFPFADLTRIPQKSELFQSEILNLGYESFVSRDQQYLFAPTPELTHR